MSRLRAAIPPRPAPVLAGWLEPGTPDVAARVVRRALAYCGVEETAPNRGPEIDRWLRWAHVPEALIERGKGWWCAAFAGAVLREEGLRVPVDYANCDAWIPFLVPAHQPSPGDIVLYGLKKGATLDAHHIGIVVRVSKAWLEIRTVEGNRSWAGTASNNGVAVDLGPMTRRDVLGYIPLTVFAQTDDARGFP